MDVAVVDGQRLPPAPGLKGVCERCGAPAQAKCGPIVRWHWAHAGRRHCDPWKENEGPWHRAWKELFPFEWRENVRFDLSTGEKHVADVQRADGLVIELQNSPMSLDEMRSREQFYGERMIWIVNAERFRSHISIGAALPAPEHPQLEEYQLALPIFGPNAAESWLGFFRRADLNARTSTRDLVELFHGKEFEALEGSHRGHHAWSWKQPREVWLHAGQTVFFDFDGRGCLWALVNYKGHTGKAIYPVVRERFVQAALSGAQLDFDQPPNTAVPIAPRV
ncbi:hypothetical protein LU676_07520 [Pseudomonas alloputida]|uniref:competence protein CoiA n=1 Tax=Pseudomonas alloputida TaxID=1940621 RepID=UPI001E3A0D3C|nr:competence protein CoiA family protein [Pseudomonas alloputida]MCE0902593.1 hypothetical protein [Pseudomonas alloputida]